MTVSNKTPIRIYGGFHNANEIKIFVDPRYLDNRDDTFLSDRQKMRLWKHFCGNVSCNCGSYQKATIVKGW